MTSTEQKLVVRQSIESGTDGIARILMVLLVVLLPWPFGGVAPWAQFMTLVTAGVLGVLVLVKIIRHGDVACVGTWAYWPMAGFLGLAILQIVPLPVEVVKWLSPRSVEIVQQLLVPTNVPSLGDTTTIAFYPWGTWQVLRIVMIGSLVYAAAIHCITTRAHVEFMLRGIVFAGGLLAVMTLLQTASSDGRIYWIIPAPVKSTSGPFVNYNNFSQYMNLCLGAALALLFLHDVPRAVEKYGHRRRSGSSSRGGSRRGNWSGYEFPKSLLVMVLASGGISILLSASRAGVLAMLASSAVLATILLLGQNRERSFKLMAIVGLLIGTGLAMWGVQDFFERMGTLVDPQSASGARWQVFQDVLKMIPQFPAVGIGLGNHEWVYPMFSKLPNWRNAMHVENEYLQVTEEMGFAGLALVVIFVAVIATQYVRSLRSGNPVKRALAAGLGYGLIAILVQCITDLGQHLASVAWLTALTCGLMSVVSRLPANEVPAASSKELPPARRGGRFVIAMAAGVLAMAGVGQLSVSAFQATMGDEHWQRAKKIENSLGNQKWAWNEGQYAMLLRHIDRAVVWDPANGEYLYWQAVYRWHSLEAQAAILAATPLETQPAQPATQSAQSATLPDLAGDPEKLAAPDLVKSLHEGQRLCPTFGPAYCLSGQIRLFTLEEKEGAAEIRKGALLAPRHREVQFVLGRLEAQEGNWPEAKVALAKALEVNEPAQEVVNLLVTGHDRPEMAFELLEGRYDDLGYLVDLLVQRNHDDEAKICEAVVASRDQWLQTACEQPNPPPQVLAAMADSLRKRHQFLKAAGYYRRALDYDYGNIGWRVGLAKVLMAEGDRVEARRELNTCLRQHPDSKEAQRLLKELDTEPIPGPG